MIYLAKWRNADCIVKQLQEQEAEETFLKEALIMRYMTCCPFLDMRIVRSDLIPMCVDSMEFVSPKHLFVLCWKR